MNDAARGLYWLSKVGETMILAAAHDLRRVVAEMGDWSEIKELTRLAGR